MGNVVWSAHPLEMFGESQALRLFDPNHKLLATMIIEKGLGLPSQTYTEAVSMCKVMDQLPAFMKPLHESSAGGNVADKQVRNLGNHCEQSYPAFITEVTYLFSCKFLKYNLMIFCFNTDPTGNCQRNLNDSCDGLPFVGVVFWTD